MNKCRKCKTTEIPSGKFYCQECQSKLDQAIQAKMLEQMDDSDVDFGPRKLYSDPPARRKLYTEGVD